MVAGDEHRSRGRRHSSSLFPGVDSWDAAGGRSLLTGLIPRIARMVSSAWSHIARVTLASKSLSHTLYTCSSARATCGVPLVPETSVGRPMSSSAAMLAQSSSDSVADAVQVLNS